VTWRSSRVRTHARTCGSLLVLASICDTQHGWLFLCRFCCLPLRQDLCQVIISQSAASSELLVNSICHALQNIVSYITYNQFFITGTKCRIPRGQEKFLCIVDLKGWGYSNWDIRAYIAAIEIMQVHLPAIISARFQ
jgi:hypothetical protein